jgi:hypothetical protein
MCGTSAASSQPLRLQYRRARGPTIASAWPARITNGFPQPQHVFGHPLGKYGAIFFMSQTRMNDESDNGDDQRHPQRRRDIELRRSVVATKRSMRLPHSFLLKSFARYKRPVTQVRLCISLAGASIRPTDSTLTLWFGRCSLRGSAAPSRTSLPARGECNLAKRFNRRFLWQMIPFAWTSHRSITFL